jgi:phage repressor protein C with HTH and peptisase S24 domain
MGEDWRMARALLPWQLVRVSGPSMVPTLRDGDLLIVRRGATVRPGDVVLGRFHSIPGRWVVKRAVRPRSDGWEVASDNPFAGGDSAVHGSAQVFGRVVAVHRGGRGLWHRPGPAPR